MGMKVRTETDLVKTCLEYLEIKQVFAWRNNSGAAMVPAKNGQKRRFIAYGKKGSADILGILPDGRFLAIECKMPKKYPNKDQKAFLQRIEDNGGVALIIRDVGDLIALLEEHGC